jgi:hypothetical protein
MLKSLLQSPPAALRQGIVWTAVDHVVNVDVLAPVTTRSPQTGNGTDGSRPRSRWLVLPYSGRIVAENTRCKDFFFFLWPSDRETHENVLTVFLDLVVDLQHRPDGHPPLQHGPVGLVAVVAG